MDTAFLRISQPRLAIEALCQVLEIMSERAFIKNYHVYILFSSTLQWVKVGKSNNTRRTIDLARMGYAGAEDWAHMASFPVQSDHEAIALESMIISRLSHKDFKIPRQEWINKINGRRSYADECFSCSVDQAISIACHMLTVLIHHVRRDVLESEACS